MNAYSKWVCVGVYYGEQPFKLDGVDVWKHKWIDTKERVEIEDPHYRQKFIFHVYDIRIGDKLVRFATGEFSNCVWGFYQIR